MTKPLKPLSFDVFLLIHLGALACILYISQHCPEFTVNWFYLVGNLFILIPTFEIKRRVVLRLANFHYPNLHDVFVTYCSYHTALYFNLLMLSVFPLPVVWYIIVLYTLANVAGQIYRLSTLSAGQKSFLVWGVSCMYLCSLPISKLDDSWWIVYVQSYIFVISIAVTIHEHASFQDKIKALIVVILGSQLLWVWGYSIETSIWKTAIQNLRDNNQHGVYGMSRQVAILPF